MTIRSHQGDYDVVSAGSIADLAGTHSTGDTFAIGDERVFALHPELAGLCGAERTYLLAAAEEEKTLQGVERFCRFLQQKGASKQSRLLVVGGGITQDIGTFAAHVYYRGIPFTYVPTTLLAMADSCIGAKCAVNLGAFKNQLGFFQSPQRVVVWTGFLNTLPQDDVRSGYGEIVKLAITAGEDDFRALADRMESAGLVVEGIEPFILRSLATKRRVIEEDEYEHSARKTLNYGHTFGHALESLTDHEVPHGLAVAWGIDVANYVAVQMGVLPKKTFEEIHSLLAAHFTFKVNAPYDASGLIAAIRRDKKAAGAMVTLILLEGIGRLRLVPTGIGPELEKHVAGYLSTCNIFQ